MMLASGYAPRYTEPSLDSGQMALVKHAIDRMLQRHEPHPAIVLDRLWNVVRTNQAAPRFFGSFIDLENRPKPRNLLELMFDPEGMKPFVENWEAVAAALIQRVHREAIGQILDADLQSLVQRLRAYPGAQDIRLSAEQQSPVIPIVFRKGEESFRYCSLITTVGTPQCITAQELRVECMYPMDGSVPG